MKKVFATMLALALAMGFVACGGGAGSTTNSAVESAPVEETVDETSDVTVDDDIQVEEPDAGQEAGEAEDAAAEDDGEGDWAYMQAKGEMIIGITYFEPMNYLEDDGTLTGFETEFATAVCEILGLEPVFQEISWASKEIELAAKNIDAIWNGMTITPDREENMSIAQPYMQNMQVLIVKSENADAAAESVDGLVIVAEAGSAGEEVVESEAFFAEASFTPVDTQAKGLMEVAAGTADGCVVDYVLSIGMIGEGTDFADLVALDTRTFEEEQYGIALRKEDTEFTQKVNDAINELLANGTLQEIAAKYKLEDLLITG